MSCEECEYTSEYEESIICQCVCYIPSQAMSSHSTDQLPGQVLEQHRGHHQHGGAAHPQLQGWQGAGEIYFCDL